MARSVKPGRHATPDRSFSRSTGSAAMRGGVLLAVAVVLGVVLLNTSDDGPSGPSVTIATTDTNPVNVPDSTGANGDGTTVPAVVTSTVAVGRSPVDVKVLFANGSTIKGAAAAGSEKVRSAGYTMLGPTDATAKPRETAVYYVAGYEAEAADLAARLVIPTPQVQVLPPAPPVTDLQGANILVVVGTGLATTLTQTNVAAPS